MTGSKPKSARRRIVRRQGHVRRRLHNRRDQPRLATTPASTMGKANAMLDCGWGRLLFAQTFADPAELAAAMRGEGPDRRDIAFYVTDPHVLLAQAPQELFLDPSHTFRLDLANYQGDSEAPVTFTIRQLSSRLDAEGVNAIYAARDMVQIAPEFFWSQRDARSVIVLVAEDALSGEIIGTVMGVDHERAFADPERGASLWCLAVAPQANHAGIGEMLVRRLADQFRARGLAFLDLSVIIDNDLAIGLYDKLGFTRVPYFAVKRKNVINEKLFTGEEHLEGLNPYALIVVNEARRRGIHVEVTDALGGFFRLTYGGRSVHCREALSEFTSAVAMSICDDKTITRRVVERAGVRVPAQLDADADGPALEAFLERHDELVVKPARGEQGRGISVGITTMPDLERAIERAREQCDRVLIEECVRGEDLRLVVIDFKLVAAALRKPASIFGDGSMTVRELIGKQSRRRAAATGGESRIPMDGETERCIAAQGYGLDDVLEEGVELPVRRTANLHTGGTIHDVTDHTHPVLVQAAIDAARAIDIPVTGIDFIVRSPTEPDYVFIEANERPGLANHEPQPTAERFVDLLFPLSIPAALRQARKESSP